MTDQKKPFDQVDFIIAYEGGELTWGETIEGFSHLIKSGLCWKLQGSYGRTAKHMIDGAYITPAGEIIADPN